MAELLGGTTIGGYPAIHSGMTEVKLTGKVVIGGNIIPSESLEVVGNVKVSGNLTWNNGADSLDALKSSVSSGKTSIASAITAKGVAASGSDTHAQLATKVGQITTGISDTETTGVFQETIAKGDKIYAAASYLNSTAVINVAANSSPYDANTASFISDNGYVFVSDDYNGTAIFQWYKHDKYSPLVGLPKPAIAPSGFGSWGVSGDATGTYINLAYSDTTNRLFLYKRTGDTLTKLANPSTLPPSYTRSSCTTRDGMYLAMGTLTSGQQLIIYKRSGDTWTKLANPAIQPQGTIWGASGFSADGAYLVVGTNGVSGLNVYKRTGDVFDRIYVPTSTLGEMYSLRFHPSRYIFAVEGYGGDYIEVFKINDNATVTKIPLTGIPSGLYGSVAWLDGGRYLAMGLYTAPYIAIYAFNELNLNSIPFVGNGNFGLTSYAEYMENSVYDNSVILYDNGVKKANPTHTVYKSNGNTIDSRKGSLGYAVEAGSLGQTKQISLIWR